MKILGRYKGINIDYATGDTIVSFATSEKPRVIEEQMINIADKPLEIKADVKLKKRSLDANAMLWSCLHDLAIARNEDNWDLYLEMLRKYGEYAYICVKPNAVESVKKQWREAQELGEIDINGQKAIQMLCFFGSSTYDSKQFSRLLDGVIKEMAQENLPLPMSKHDMQLAIERLDNAKCVTG